MFGMHWHTNYKDQMPQIIIRTNDKCFWLCWGMAEILWVNLIIHNCCVFFCLVSIKQTFDFNFDSAHHAISILSLSLSLFAKNNIWNQIISFACKTYLWLETADIISDICYRNKLSFGWCIRKRTLCNYGIIAVWTGRLFQCSNLFGFDSVARFVSKKKTMSNYR